MKPGNQPTRPARLDMAARVWCQVLQDGSVLKDERELVKASLREKPFSFHPLFPFYKTVERGTPHS